MPWVAYGEWHAAPFWPRVRAILGIFRWGQTEAAWLGPVLAGLELGHPVRVSALSGAENGAWCATLHFREAGVLAVTSGIESSPPHETILRGSEGVCRIAAHELAGPVDRHAMATAQNMIEMAKASGKPVFWNDWITRPGNRAWRTV